MISQCGAVFFLFGNKIDENGLTNAAGVKKEFDIAVKMVSMFPYWCNWIYGKRISRYCSWRFQKV